MFEHEMACVGVDDGFAKSMSVVRLETATRSKVVVVVVVLVLVVVVVLVLVVRQNQAKSGRWQGPKLVVDKR